MISTPGKIPPKARLCEAEGWEVEGENVWAYGKCFPLVDPIAIHGKVYRTHESHQERFNAMKRCFELQWPHRVKTFNYWMERVFWEHTNHETEVFTLCGGGGIGKAIPVSTPVQTPSGKVPIGELKVGSRICNTEGGQQKVLGVYPQGKRHSYQVTLTDGTSTVVDGEHLWTVYSSKQRDHESGPQTITTLELKKHITKDFSLPGYTPTLGKHQEFEIHPYLMGVLLGNGGLSAAGVKAWISNDETLKEIKPHCSFSKKFDNNCWNLVIYGIRHLLPKMVANNKKVPDRKYLYASISQRLDLLQGLLDTDGYCAKSGTAQYTTVSPDLKDDVAELARGLGLIVSISSKIPTYTYKGEKKKGQLAYTLTLRRTRETRDLQLFRVHHKLARSQGERRQYAHRKIVSVTKLRAKQEMVCIKVSHPNQLFLINDYIVTHNTETAALVVCLFWLPLPYHRAAIVTSTELASLRNRIYGYILRDLKEAKFKPNLTISNSPPPSIRADSDNFMCGIFGVAAKKGDDDRTIESIKGRHPKNALLLVLDEATDMPLGITSVIPNLKKSLEDRFQAMALGNSKSWTDLHGMWSLPKMGIENLDPHKHFRWETTQPGGVALYFNPYDSPAIHEKDPEKKILLSKFLPTTEKLLKAEQDEGTESEGFWQFTMGFWRSKSYDSVLLSEAFLKDYNPTGRAEFTGKVPLVYAAGLDPSFSVGGDKTILRLAALGQHVNGKMVLDYRGQSLLFEIKLKAGTGLSAEKQIALQVIPILKQYRVPLNHLCVDSSGQGRGLADVIQLMAESHLTPTKVYSTNIGRHDKNALDIVCMAPYEMWMKGREFISNMQIYGIDAAAHVQLYNRKVIDKNGKKSLEPKVDYKRRMAIATPHLSHSPDEADTAMLTIQSAILHHGFHPGQMNKVEVYHSALTRQLEQAHAAYAAREAGKLTGNLVAGYTRGIASLVKKKWF